MKMLLSMLLLGAGAITGTAFAQDRSERLTLGGGTTTVKDQIKGRDAVQYAFTAQPGQQLLIRLASSNPSAYLNLEKDGASEALCQGAMTGNVCALRAETAAEYVIDVYLMRNAARRGESASYTLTIEPSGGSASTAPSTSTASAKPTAPDAKAAAADAVAACKSALALKSGANAVFVLPMSHVPAAGGYEVFLSLKGAQWLCTTDSRGNVNRLEQR